MNSNSIFVGVLIMLLVACGADRWFEQYHSFEQANWHKDSVATFQLEVEDTTQFHDFFLHIRNNNDYPYRNFYTFMTIVFPNQKMDRDTLNLPLADLSGKWLGKGLGEVKDSKYIFRKRLRFPLKGTYTFRFVQGMRQENLEGISDIGLEISQSEKQ